MYSIKPLETIKDLFSFIKQKIMKFQAMRSNFATITLILFFSSQNIEAGAELLEESNIVCEDTQHGKEVFGESYLMSKTLNGFCHGNIEQMVLNKKCSDESTDGEEDCCLNGCTLKEYLSESAEIATDNLNETGDFSQQLIIAENNNINKIISDFENRFAAQQSLVQHFKERYEDQLNAIKVILVSIKLE